MKTWKFTSKWWTDLHDQSNNCNDSVSHWHVSLNEIERRGPAATTLIFPAEESLSKEVVGFKVGNPDRRRAFQERTMKGFRTDRVSDFRHFNGCVSVETFLTQSSSSSHWWGAHLMRNSLKTRLRAATDFFASLLAHESVDTRHALRLANTVLLRSEPFCDDGWRHPHILITGPINQINAYLSFTVNCRRRGRF